MGKTSAVRQSITEINDDFKSGVNIGRFWKLCVTLFYNFITFGLIFLIYNLTIDSLFNSWCYITHEVYDLNIDSNISRRLFKTFILFLCAIGFTYKFARDLVFINDVKNHLKKYEEIEINLSQEDVKDIDILRQMAKGLMSKWLSLDRTKWNSILQVLLRVSYIITWLLSGFWATKGEMRRLSYRNILKRLTVLNERLNAQVSFGKKLDVSPTVSPTLTYGLFRLSTFSYIKGRQVNHPIATAKEIENELINILNDIDLYRKKKQVYTRKGDRWHEKLRKMTKKIFFPFDRSHIPEFIFIVDELDKIEPNYNYSIKDDNEISEIFTKDKVRQRQEVIEKLLANLKSFLNVARAKFFFIGGREMYDASLADIADRDSFYSSIFHDVIYVNSFLKDKIEKGSGITQMTETYLCKLIMCPGILEEIYNKNKGIPDPKFDSAYTLKTLNHYWDFLNKRRNNLEVLKAERYKTIYLLQNFVIFLTYRSNGTPKKLVGLIEDYIVSKKTIDDIKTQIVIQNPPYRNNILDNQNKKNRERLFLRFKYNAQYEIGFTSFLYRPYLIINSRYIKALGDKILFSNAFIFDHILKFHSTGFSWRNLELIPEVILTNKEPNLRVFIDDIIQFLSGNVIRSTVSGLFQFKFYNKVANEIKFISQISDLSAAAYNFTLDESQLIKRYYKRKLQELINRHKNDFSNTQKNRFIHSVGFIYTILGDLHFYDNEYDDALMYYTDAVQPFRSAPKFKEITKHQALLYIRSHLKIGLTLEKMRAYDSAYSIYRSLMLDIPEMLKNVSVENESGQIADYGLRPYHGVQMLNKPYIAYLNVLEKYRYDGINYANLEKNRVEYLHFFTQIPIKAREFFKKLNQSLITTNIDKDDLNDVKRISTLKADYYNNVGSILFYKNSSFEKHDLNVFGISTPKQGKDFYPSVSAFYYYMTSLRHYLNSATGTNEKDQTTDFNEIIIEAANLLISPDKYFINSNLLYNIGNILSKIGDALLTFIDNENNTTLLGSEILEMFRWDSSQSADIASRIRSFFIKTKLKSVLDIDTSLIIYRLAGRFYLKAGREYSYAFQYKKFLYIVKDYIEVNYDFIKDNYEDVTICNQSIRIIDKQLYEKIAIKIFNSITWVSKVSNRPQILKYREVLDIKNRNEDRDFIYNNISTSNEAKEAIFLVEEIKLKINRIIGNNNYPLNNFFNTPYSNISSKFVRILELKYRCELNYSLFREFVGENNISELLSPSIDIDKLKDIKNFQANILQDSKHEKWEGILIKIDPKFKASGLSNSDCSDIVKFLIQDSIFCLFDIVKAINIFGINYTTNNSFLANAHRKLGNWCQILEHLNNDEDIKENLQNGLKKLLGTDAIYQLEPRYHYELSINYSYSAIQMHSEGKAYKETLNHMYFLQDDFNDNLYHFCASNERYRINTGVVRSKINRMKKHVGKSRVYKYESYI